MQELQKILDDALQSFAAIEDAAELENVKARYLGKEGSLTGVGYPPELAGGHRRRGSNPASRFIG